MSTDTVSTRRSLLKVGALLAAPMAAAAPVAAMAQDSRAASSPALIRRSQAW